MPKDMTLSKTNFYKRLLHDQRIKIHHSCSCQQSVIHTRWRRKFLTIDMFKFTDVTASHVYTCGCQDAISRTNTMLVRVTRRQSFVTFFILDDDAWRHALNQSTNQNIREIRFKHTHALNLSHIAISTLSAVRSLQKRLVTAHLFGSCVIQMASVHSISKCFAHKWPG